MTDANKTRYVYTFSVWPNERWCYSRSLFDVFRLANPRVEMPFTETGFELFRSNLSHDGFTLRAIVRKPWHEDEVVI